MASDNSWAKIFDDHQIEAHDFDTSPYPLSAEAIKQSVQGFTRTSDREVRILCSQTKREDVPAVMREMGLFLLPVENGQYVLVRGEGYVDIPEITSKPVIHESALGWKLVSAQFGDSEMQHLDHAFAVSIIRTFVDDASLQLAIRGRKWTQGIRFSFGVNGTEVQVGSVQTEVDAGYEGKAQIALIEAKNSQTTNTIIRQLYYPYRLWSARASNKQVRPLFFEKRGDEYLLWEFGFADIDDYNSIQLVKSARYKLG